MFAEVWNQILEVATGITAQLEAYSGTITAIATLVLASLTWVLARATKAMASATSMANVVASLEINQWSLMYMDLVVQNTGNAPAYEVKVTFDPPLPYMGDQGKVGPPFGTISVMRPGQALTTGVNNFNAIKQSVYRVTLTWKPKPTSSRILSNSYNIDIAALGAISRIGSGSPAVELAEQVKKLREDWRHIARGQQRLKVDGFSQADRESEHKQEEEMFREMQKRQAAAEAAKDQAAED